MIRRPAVSELEAAAELLHRVAGEHGLSELHFGDEQGEIVAVVEPGRTYFDLVAFADNVESRLGWRPTVVPATAPGARPGGKLTRRTTAA